MEQTINTVVQGVERKEVTRKSDGKPITLYEIIDSNNVRWTTGIPANANAAHALIGKPASLFVRVEQNGAYENRYLQGITPVGGSPQATPTAPPTAFPAPNGAWGSQTATVPPDTLTSLPVASQTDPRQVSIHRQVAAKVSARLSNTPNEFWGNLDHLVTYFETGRKPQDQGMLGYATDPVDEGIPF